MKLSKLPVLVDALDDIPLVDDRAGETNDELDSEGDGDLEKL